MSQPSLILQCSCLVLSCLVSLETGTSLLHNRGAHGLIAPPWSCLALSWRKLGCPWLVQGQGQGFEAPPDPPEPKRCSPRVSPISSLSLQTPRPRGVTIKTSPFPVSRCRRPLFSSQLSSHLFPHNTFSVFGCFHWALSLFATYQPLSLNQLYSLQVVVNLSLRRLSITARHIENCNIKQAYNSKQLHYIHTHTRHNVHKSFLRCRHGSGLCWHGLCPDLHRLQPIEEE